MFDGAGGFDALDGAADVVVAGIEERTYAMVASPDNDGVQIIDITDPRRPISTASAIARVDGFAAWDSIGGIAVSPYSSHILVTDNAGGIQVTDISYPDKPEPAYSIFDGMSGFDALAGAHGIAVTGNGYVLVASWENDGVQIINPVDSDTLLAYGTGTGWHLTGSSESVVISTFRWRAASGS